MLQYNERRIAWSFIYEAIRNYFILIYREIGILLYEFSSRTTYIVAVPAYSHFTGKRRERQRGYAGKGGIVVASLVAIWRKNIVSSLSQMVGEFILISPVDNLFEAKRKITSSTVNEFSLIIFRRSNLGVCNSSIFLGRVSSMRLGLMHALKSLLLCSSRCSL